jgi:hypothetical protein
LKKERGFGRIYKVWMIIVYLKKIKKVSVFKNFKEVENLIKIITLDQAKEVNYNI